MGHDRETEPLKRCLSLSWDAYSGHLANITDVFRKRKQLQMRRWRQEEGDSLHITKRGLRRKQAHPHQIGKSRIDQDNCYIQVKLGQSMNLLGLLQEYKWEVTYRSRDDSKIAKSLKKFPSHYAWWWLMKLGSSEFSAWTCSTNPCNGWRISPQHMFTALSLCDFHFSFPTRMNFVDFLHLVILPPLPGRNV